MNSIIKKTIYISGVLALMSFTILKGESLTESLSQNTKEKITSLNDSKTTIDKKIRVIHTSDMGFDDKNSLVRMLLFANNQNIIGITPSAGPWQNMIDNEYEDILAKIDLYEKVYDNLKLHDPNYPTPDYLRSITVRGNVDCIGDYPDHSYDYSTDTEGSMLIANALLDETDDSPIWVTCWGGPLTLTAALRYINDNFPNKKSYVANKLKIYIIAAKYQDSKDRELTKYIIDNYSPAPIIIDQSHWQYTNGWGEIKYWCNNVDYSTESWTNTNYNKNHGVLCNSFGWKNKNNDDVDGDAPALLHILGSALGLRSNENPSYGGWGGRFSATPDQYKCFNSEDVIDAWDGPNKLPSDNPDYRIQQYCYDGARWADNFQNELAVRADWCVKSYSEANHPPVINMISDNNIDAIPGETINLNCKATDPDGDKLSYSWWQYKEAGTAQTPIIIIGANKSNASFICPDETGKTIHIILEVQDDGTEHPLTRYARVIVNIADE